MGTIGIILNYMLLYGAILLIGALSGYISERVGIVNIGIDGMMCFGAVFFGIFSSNAIFGSSTFGTAGIILALIATMICTCVTGVMHAYSTINLKANHIISGTAINLIGVAFATFANGPIGVALYDGSSKISTNFNDFLYIGDSIYGSSIIMFALALIIALIIFVVINYTKTGLRCKAVGENPYAIDALGISVTKYQWVCVILSSALAGLAGAIFMFNVKQFEGNTQGLGYLALAIMIIGAWRVEWITVASIVFALFTAWSLTPVLTNIGFPKEVSLSLPYIVTIIVLVFFSKWVRAPEHDGIPFEKNLR